MPACGTGADGAQEPAAPHSSAPQSSGEYTGRYRVTATVLESPDHGPQLCHAVQESLPPQCEGPDVEGWDWDEVDAEQQGGTTWGEYTLTGTWDAASRTFTPTAPAEPPPKDLPAPVDPAPTDPEGGPGESGRTPAELLDVQNRIMEEFPDVLGAHVDQERRVVVAQALVDTPDLRRGVAEAYGEGTVALDFWLERVDG